MHKFSKIGKFRNTVSAVKYHAQTTLPTYDYIGTVKLHGTNGGVRRTPSGEIIPQSRSRVLNVDSDNYDFAKFIKSREPQLTLMFNKFFRPDDDVTLYGEYCGGSIASNVALNQLDRHFVIFNMRVNGEYPSNEYPLDAAMCDNNSHIYNIFQIPYYEISINFMDPTTVVPKINEWTTEVDASCPWGKFRGVEGHGEGIVWVPRQFPEISDLWFKTKGGTHSGKPKSRGIQAKLTVEEANTISECVDLVLPEWRLRQGIDFLISESQINGMKSIGPYIKWVSQDVIAEEMDVIVENGLEWNAVQRPIAARAREYFMGYLNSDGLEV